MRAIEKILDLARWAPSGDNTQPWRFEIVDDMNLVVHGFDTRDHCVYDLDGHASQLALGCLLETMVIAASGSGFRVEISRRAEMPEAQPTFDVRFVAAEIAPDPLLPCIPERRVQRRAMRARRLRADEKSALEQALAPHYTILWKETWAEKWQAAGLMYANAKIRLTSPEAYRVHRAIIEWDAQFSETMVPDQAVGVDPLTLKLMRWAMQSWTRIDILNRYFMGTVAPRVQLDLIPGLACAAHFGLVADAAAESLDDYVAAGRAVQRFWLTATQLGLQLQPEMTPVIFSRYIRAGRAFTASPAPLALAKKLAGRFAEFVGRENAPRTVFLGRLGEGAAASARSTRLPLARLMKT
jgi:sulfur-carrier protein adenylyltransferase/sulfurtransferase